MPQVMSKVNGLIINIPADAKGVINRFKSEGDNELIFDRAGFSDSAKSAVKSASVKIESETKGRSRPRSAEALA